MTNSEKFQEAFEDKLNSLNDRELFRVILLMTEVIDSPIIKPKPPRNGGVGTNQ